MHGSATFLWVLIRFSAKPPPAVSPSRCGCQRQLKGPRPPEEPGRRLCSAAANALRKKGGCESRGPAQAPEDPGWEAPAVSLQPPAPPSPRFQSLVVLVELGYQTTGGRGQTDLIDGPTQRLRRSVCTAVLLTCPASSLAMRGAGAALHKQTGFFFREPGWQVVILHLHNPAGPAGPLF